MKVSNETLVKWLNKGPLIGAAKAASHDENGRLTERPAMAGSGRSAFRREAGKPADGRGASLPGSSGQFKRRHSWIERIRGSFIQRNKPNLQVHHEAR